MSDDKDFLKEVEKYYEQDKAWSREEIEEFEFFKEHHLKQANLYSLKIELYKQWIDGKITHDEFHTQKLNLHAEDRKLFKVWAEKTMLEMKEKKAKKENQGPVAQ